MQAVLTEADWLDKNMERCGRASGVLPMVDQSFQSLVASCRVHSRRPFAPSNVSRNSLPRDSNPVCATRQRTITLEIIGD
jgi:hypothetical protein